MNNNSKTKSYYEYFLAVIIIFAIYLGSILYITWPISEYSISKAGTLGDSFGVITSLFTGLAFAGVLITLHHQREELKIAREEYALTRKEMELARIDSHDQAIERTFFSMINMLYDIKGRVSHPKISENYPGIDVFMLFCNDFKKIIAQSFKDQLENTGFSDENGLKQSYRNAYHTFYESSQPALGHYFRYLYRIFKYIDIETGDKAMLYSKILRAQLSNFEMALLFYNGLSEYGEKFKPLLEKYSVFDNLPVKILSRIPEINHTFLYKVTAWGNNSGYKKHQ